MNTTLDAETLDLIQKTADYELGIYHLMSGVAAGYLSCIADNTYVMDGIWVPEESIQRMQNAARVALGRMSAMEAEYKRLVTEKRKPKEDAA